MMNIAQQIEQLVKQDFECSEFFLENESHMHGNTATQSHYKLIFISDDFVAKRAVQRHQMIYTTLASLMNNPIHGLALHLFTVGEWAVKENKQLLSPKCLGGSK
ncbi:BolA/IbaG family iron-sulfur metabolism protein [Gammaproteobacteria bacterium AS21]|jgi:BolA protein